MKQLTLIFFIVIGITIHLQGQVKHKIGDLFGGGIVFSVSDDGLHGLIAETQDQGQCIWDDAASLIKNANNHSAEAKKFLDWRLPTQGELNILFEKREMIGKFGKSPYWSSTEFEGGNAWIQSFNSGKQGNMNKGFTMFIRSVRSF